MILIGLIASVFLSVLWNKQFFYWIGFALITLTISLLWGVLAFKDAHLWLMGICALYISWLSIVEMPKLWRTSKFKDFSDLKWRRG